MSSIEDSNLSQRRPTAQPLNRPIRKIPRDGCAWEPNDSAVRCVLLFYLLKTLSSACHLLKKALLSVVSSTEDSTVISLMSSTEDSTVISCIIY